MEKKRTIEWTPDCFEKEVEKEVEGKKVKVKETRYEGHLVVQVPLSEARCDILVELGIMDMGGDDVAAQSKTANAKLLMSVWKQTKNLIIEAKVKRISDGAELDLDDVLHEQDLFAMPFQFAEKYINGFGPGNG